VKKVNSISKFKSIAILLLATAMPLFGSGCTNIKLISDYDEKTDEAITSLQRKFETFFVILENKVGTEEAAHKNHIEFYQQVKVDISAIHLRVRALPQNKITEQQIDLLKENVEILEDFHKDGIHTIEVIQAPREDFNRALSNILKLELAKKRGEES